MRNLTAEEAEALQGLRNGDPQPLARVLSLENLDVHPLIQRAIVTLINGVSSQTDYRLQLIPHPDLGDQRNSLKAKSAKERREIEIAITYAEHGGFIRGLGKAALHAAMTAHRAKRTVVMDAWSQYKVFVARGIQAGHITVSPELKPTLAQYRAIVRIAA